MAPTAELDAAVHNTADWVSSVCRAHRFGWSFSPCAWRSANPTPQFHPEAITLRPNATAEDGHPLVGYEHGDDLALAHAAGFRFLGPLRIWSRTPENEVGDVLGDGHA
ncbi:MAG: hypothetical protein SYR96_07080 [Actinomycetota bacterium]|nr:hypothetical protein [Actinomycetota bacterium]